MKVIVTGVTGMVGEGVLHECIRSADVESILVISRKTCKLNNPKLTEIIHDDFFEWTSLQSTLTGYNACFFCLGVTSVGKDKLLYERMTYNLTIGFAKMLVKANTDMQFCYVSGAGTDSTETARLHWARVKGKTENDLQKLGFKNTWLFRPGILEPTKGLKNTLGFYKWMGWLMPVFKKFFPNKISSLAQLGQAMISVVKNGYNKNVLEVTDIKKLAGSNYLSTPPL